MAVREYRRTRRQNLSPVARLDLLDIDADDIEAEVHDFKREMRRELGTIKGLCMGVFASVMAATVVGALNLLYMRAG